MDERVVGINGAGIGSIAARSTGSRTTTLGGKKGGFG
jgi:hypothetical protein